MTALDEGLAQLSAGIENLSTRATAALFAACACGLRPGFLEWAALRRTGTEALLEQALRSALAFARGGVTDIDTRDLLRLLEEATPPGDAPDLVSSTVAQDCWICADTAIRVIVEPGFRAGPVIEYALEPILHATTERLFGVSQVGSGNAEETQLAAVLRDDQVSEAFAFCRWAIDILLRTPEPNDEVTHALCSRAAALLPK